MQLENNGIARDDVITYFPAVPVGNALLVAIGTLIKKHTHAKKYERNRRLAG